MKMLFTAVHESGSGTNRKSAHVRCDVGFRGDKQTCYAHVEFFRL